MLTYITGVPKLTELEKYDLIFADDRFCIRSQICLIPDFILIQENSTLKKLLHFLPRFLRRHILENITNTKAKSDTHKYLILIATEKENADVVSKVLIETLDCIENVAIEMSIAATQ